MTHDAYLLGRAPASLEAPFKGCNKAYGGALLDAKTIERADFANCTFANVRFKKVRLSHSTFLHCIFIGCYFRRATFVNTSFVGCRFIDCEFPYVAINSCDFRYATFKGCCIPYSEIQYSLPTEPNLRENLARNLTVEASHLGVIDEARKFRVCEIRALEENLLAAVRGQSQWYRDHYHGVRRTQAALKLCRSYADRLLWGYGERPWVLIRNFLVVSCVVFPLLFFSMRDQLESVTHKNVTLPDVFYFSLQNVVPGYTQPNIRPIGPYARFFGGLESLVAVVAASLLASYYFRRILNR
jgi:hypothetical protein